MTSSPTCTGKLWGSSQQHLCASDPFPAHLLTCTFQGIPGHHQVLSLTSQWSLIRAHLSHRDFCAVLASPRLSLCTEGPCPCLPLKMKSWASQWHNPGASPRPRLCSIPLPVWHLHFRYQHKSQIKLQFSPPLTQVCFSIPCAGKGSPTRTALPGWVLAPPPPSLLSQPTAILPLCCSTGEAHGLMLVLASVRLAWSCIQQTVLMRGHGDRQASAGEKQC